jgi:hypothetical protein
LTTVLWAGALGIPSPELSAAEAKEAPQPPGAAQRLFASPEEAIKALQLATEAKDKAALRGIFGPQFLELVAGDEVQDASNAQKFATALAQGCKLVKDGEDKIVNQDGKVYQRNLGERTSQIAPAIKEYNPDSQWTLEPDGGVASAVSEK